MRCFEATASLLLLAAAASSLCAQAKDSAANSSGTPRTAHYELKFQELNYVFGPLPPVMRVHAGDIIDTTTVDADGKTLEEAGIKATGPNPLTGPFYVEEAEPGDTLAVRFLTIEPYIPSINRRMWRHFTPMIQTSPSRFPCIRS
jgi:hypothetical protein